MPMRIGRAKVSGVAVALGKDYVRGWPGRLQTIGVD